MNSYYSCRCSSNRNMEKKKKHKLQKHNSTNATSNSNNKQQQASNNNNNSQQQPTTANNIITNSRSSNKKIKKVQVAEVLKEVNIKCFSFMSSDMGRVPLNPHPFFSFCLEVGGHHCLIFVVITTLCGNGKVNAERSSKCCCSWSSLCCPSFSKTLLPLKPIQNRDFWASWKSSIQIVCWKSSIQIESWQSSIQIECWKSRIQIKSSATISCPLLLPPKWLQKEHVFFSVMSSLRTLQIGADPENLDFVISGVRTEENLVNSPSRQNSHKPGLVNQCSATPRGGGVN